MTGVVTRAQEGTAARRCSLTLWFRASRIRIKGIDPERKSMTNKPQLTPRKAEILRNIVREYIETGEPVASRTISRRRKGSLSPASIRNVMADLCEEGYLAQPHTSAGRVPTEKAFQFFVQEIGVPRPSHADYELLRAQLQGADTIENGVARSSHLLTALTRSVSIVAAIPTASQTLEQIELVPLSDRRVLAVVVTHDRAVRNRVVMLDEAMSAEELASIRNYLNYHFQGWVLSDIRRELEHRLEVESAYYDALHKRLTVLYARGLLDIDLDPEVHLDGASYLVSLDLHLTRERMRELLHALEEKKRLLQLLDRFLEQPAGAVAVCLGLGDLHPAMRELALIGMTVAMPSGIAAKVAVLGPMRMHYEKVMAAVLNVGRALQALPS